MAATSKTKKVFDNRYEILSIVGRGAGSVVYHARHIDSPASEVALKVLVDHNAETRNSERLRKEALAMVSARHRYVLRLDDFHTLGAICYLCLEYAPESDLRRYLQKLGGRLGVAQGELYLSQAAEGLAFIHKAGIVHRDIKPDNILVINNQEIRICDFGIALLPGESSSLEELQAGVGTMSYMPPEVLEGKDFDIRADVYALGVTFYEMMSAAHPFENAPLIEQLNVRRNERIKPLKELVSGCPDYLSDIIAKMMRYDADDRYQTAREVFEAIQSKSVTPAEAAPSAKVKQFAPKERKPAASPKASEPTPDIFGFDADESQRHEEPVAALLTGTEGVHGTALQTAPHLETPIKEPLDTTNKLFNENAVAEAPKIEKPPSFMKTSSGTSTYIEPFSGLSGEAHYEDSPLEAIDPSDTAEMNSDAVKEILTNPYLDELQDVENAREQEPSTAEILEGRTEQPAPSYESDRSTARIKPHFPETPYTQSKRRAMMAPVIIIVASLVVIIMKFLAATRGPKHPHTLSSNTTPTVTEMVSATTVGLPHDQGKPLAFPVLAPGVYHGTLVRFVDKLSFPLSIISFEDRKRATMIVGLPGWTPQVLDIEKYQDLPADSKEREVLRVASNGIVLEFRGTVEDGKISGTFTNKISGEVGTWSVSRVR